MHKILTVVAGMNGIHVGLGSGHGIDVRLASNQRGNLSHWERADLVNTEVERFTGPVRIAFRLRPDAVGACKPWIDALTLGRGKRDGLGLIVDDGQKWVRAVSYEVDVTPGEPYIHIEIYSA